MNILLVAEVRNLGIISNFPFSTHPLNPVEFISLIPSNMSTSLYHHSHYLNSALIFWQNYSKTFQTIFFSQFNLAKCQLHLQEGRETRRDPFNMKWKLCCIYTNSFNELAPTHFSRLRSLQHPSYMLHSQVLLQKHNLFHCQVFPHPVLYLKSLFLSLYPTNSHLTLKLCSDSFTWVSSNLTWSFTTQVRVK